MAKEAYDDFKTYKRDIEVLLPVPRQTPNDTMSSEANSSKKLKAKISK